MTRYLYSLPDGQTRFYESEGTVYSMNGKAEFYISGDWLYSHPNGQPAYWISGRHLYRHNSSTETQPSLYFGE